MACQTVENGASALQCGWRPNPRPLTHGTPPTPALKIPAPASEYDSLVTQLPPRPRPPPHIHLQGHPVCPPCRCTRAWGTASGGGPGERRAQLLLGPVICSFWKSDCPRPVMGEKHQKLPAIGHGDRQGRPLEVGELCSIEQRELPPASLRLPFGNSPEGLGHPPFKEGQQKEKRAL